MREAKLRRLIADSNFLLELELHRLDCISCHQFMDNYLYLIDKFALLRESAEETLPKGLLNGHDLIRRGIPPGRQIGELLQSLTDLQLEGRIRTRVEAFRALDRMLAEKHKKKAV
jgi:poly(A) polymerase